MRIDPDFTRVKASGQNVTLRSSRHHPRNDRGNHMRVMLSRSSLQSVRTLKPVRAKNLQFPLIRILRSDDQHSPIPRPIRKHVFDNGNYIPLQLHVARVLHLDCNGHMESTPDRVIVFHRCTIFR
jgi:hypothetical protein